MGWNGDKGLNHFGMVRHIAEAEFYISRSELQSMFEDGKLIDLLSMIDREFSLLMIPERRELIKKCLQYRFNTIKELI